MTDHQAAGGGHTASDPAERTVQIPIGRLTKWLTGFSTRNGEFDGLDITDDGVQLNTERGGWAHLHLPEVLRRAIGTDPSASSVIEAVHNDAGSMVVALIRRGGWAVGHGSYRGADFSFTQTKNGQRYVQGKTAAGGQSQQRFARRRANQANALVGAAQAGARAVFGTQLRHTDLLVTGGDQLLLAELFDLEPLSRLEATVRRTVTVSDPRQRTLTEAMQLARSIEIRLHNAG